MSGEAERKLSLTIDVKAYGTVEQAEATARRIVSMLTVELHQEVKLSSLKVKERRRRKEFAR